ncbi:MAG: PAS domain-containing protein, partial [Planctomycetota bacterium]
MSDTDSNSDLTPDPDPTTSSPRFFWQVYSIYGVLITLGGWFFGILLFERFTQDSFNNFQRSLTEQSASFSLILTELDEASILSTLQRLQTPQTRVNLISADGQRLLNPSSNGSGMESDPLKLYPELSEFISSGAESTHTNLELDLARSDFPSVIRRFFSSKNDTQYLLRVSRDPQVLLSQSDAIYESILLLGLIAALLAMVMGHLLYRRINRQFQVLTNVAVAYSEGDFSARAPKGMDVESNLLGEALNKLADEIQDQVSEIHLEHNRLRVILGGMRDGLIAIDDLGKIVLINSVMSRILGFEIREVRGRYLSDVIEDSEIIELLMNTLKMQRPLEAELDLGLGQSEKFLKAYTSPLIDYGQDVSG